MDIVGFFKALWSNWLSLMTGIGSFVFMVLGLFEHKILKNIKKPESLRKLFWGIAIILFFVASVSVWNDEHVVVNDLRSKLDQRQKKKDISVKLGEFHGRAVLLQNGCVGVSPLPEGKTAYDVYATWHKDAYDYINEKVGYDEARLFVDSLTVQVPFPQGLSEINTKTWILTEQSKKRLRELMERLPFITLVK